VETRPDRVETGETSVLNRLDLRGVDLTGDVATVLPRPNIAGEGPRAAVRDIIAEVREHGDASLLELTERFDGVALDALRVPDAALDAAVAALSPELRAAMDAAIDGIERFHQHQVRRPEVIETDGMTIKAYQRPIRRAGLYVPGGRAEYPSTVLMTAVPARVAGVAEIALCVPPNASDGGIAPSVLAAARLAGVTEVYAVGGAQAVAAMAYGTASIAAVDVIAGPGNIYVALAKQEVAGDVGIAAAFAGPSEVVVVADDTATPDFAAIDVILQAEHGPDGLAWLVTWDEAVADAICASGDALLADAARAADVRETLSEGGYVAIVDGPEEAIAVVNAIAPEHLELQCRNAEAMADSVDNAGAIFCGSYSPASLGDYVAGPSHVLPTFGSARFASALTVTDFVKDHHVVTVNERGISRLGPHVIALADQEGLEAHAQSVRLRLDQLDENRGGGLASDEDPS
jgi:histidinol dehydrogenase